ncbi:MAG: lysophospholipid acyltransferase family protein [Pseudomonadota bacterium]
MAARYFQFVSWSSRTRKSVEPALDVVRDDLPCIFTFWHGEQFLIPTAVAKRLPLCALVSRHGDGEVQAAAMETFGIDVIRASGGRNPKKTRVKGGVQGSLEMLSALKHGTSVCMTANVPKGPARTVGRGVITIARLSGRPIYPVAHVTSRNWILNSWDHAVINLPFSKTAFVLGNPVQVDCGAGEAELEVLRGELEHELVRITQEARDCAGSKIKSGTG